MWVPQTKGKNDNRLSKLSFLEPGVSSMPNTPSSQLQLHPELAPARVLEWSCSRWSYSHAKQTLCWMSSICLISFKKNTRCVAWHISPNRSTFTSTYSEPRNVQLQSHAKSKHPFTVEQRTQNLMNYSGAIWFVLFLSNFSRPFQKQTNFLETVHQLTVNCLNFLLARCNSKQRGCPVSID